MKSNEKLMNICLEIYKELYIHSEPSADFDKLIENKITKVPDWFMKFYIETEKMEEIINKITKKHKLTKKEYMKIKTEIFLGCSPNSCKASWLESWGVNNG